MRRVMVTTLWSASALLAGALAAPCRAADKDGATDTSMATPVTAAAVTLPGTRNATGSTNPGATTLTAGDVAGGATPGTRPPVKADEGASARADAVADEFSALSASLSATQARLEALTRQQATSGSAPATLPADEDSQRAYASGVMLGRAVLRSMDEQRRVGLTLPVAQVLQGLEDSVSRRPLQLDDTTLAQRLEALDRDFTQRQRDDLARQEADGQAYMTTFLAQPHSVRQRGSAYRIEAPGSLPHLRRTDLATVSMTVRLPDGTVTDRRGDDSQAAQVRVNALMPAVTDALLHVGAGGRLTVVVAPEQAYGQAGLPPDIPGGATLIVDIRVLGISRS